MDVDLFLVLVEPAGKTFLPFAGVVVLEVFVGLEFVVLMGLIGMGVIPFASPVPFASFAHVLPQYGCTMTPSLYLCLFLQCLGMQSVERFTGPVQNSLTHTAQRKSRRCPRVRARATTDVTTGWQA